MITVGDYGQPALIQVVGIDLTKTDSQTLVVAKPDGTRVTWSPLTVTSGSIAYTIKLGDLDQAGPYRGEVVLTWGILVDPPGQETSSIFNFSVAAAL